MNWIFIGTLLGALVTSQHDTREACEGKTVVLREKGVAGKCFEHSPITSSSITSGTMLICANGVCK